MNDVEDHAWLTGRTSGDGWLECRDPASPSGDQNPSAGVADGTGRAERGAFHSFISGETIAVFDFLVRHGGAADIGEATRRVAELSGVARPAGSADGAGTGPGASRYRPPQIQVNNRQLRRIVGQAWEAMLMANDSLAFGERRPFLFQRAGAMVRLRTDAGAPCIEALGESEAYGYLARVADWVRVTDDAVLDVAPVKDAARDMLAFPEPRLPHLEDVVATPVFGESGELITRPGYHAADRLWLHRDTELGALDVPSPPRPADVAAARGALLDELLVDFPFVADADRAHAVAALVLPFVRRMIAGPTPLHLIEAPTAGSGKGLLANLISIVATGEVCEARTLPAADDEVRKMITAELGRGRPLILLDNADERRALESPALASVLTTQTWTDRLLGRTRMLSLRNRALWLLTANNPTLKVDMARRCVRIRIDPGVDRPWLRRGFRHEHPLEWAREQRARLVRAVLVLVQAWLDAGRPLAEARLGSFERWSGVIGGILAHAGIPGFLGSLEDLCEAADDEGRMWRAFTAAWWAVFGPEPTQVKALNELCETHELMVAVRGDKSPRSEQTRLGKALARVRDRAFGGLRITRGQIKARASGGLHARPGRGGRSADVPQTLQTFCRR